MAVCAVATIQGVARADGSPASHHVHLVHSYTDDVDAGWDAIGSSIPVEIEVYNGDTGQLVVHLPFQTGHSTGWSVDLPCENVPVVWTFKVDWKVNGVVQGWSPPVDFNHPSDPGCVFT